MGSQVEMGAGFPAWCVECPKDASKTSQYGRTGDADYPHDAGGGAGGGEAGGHTPLDCGPEALSRHPGSLLKMKTPLP